MYILIQYILSSSDERIEGTTRQLSSAPEGHLTRLFRGGYSGDITLISLEKGRIMF